MVRSLPSHTTLKLRKPGQNTQTEIQRRDLQQALTKAEEEHFAKKRKRLGQKGAAGEDERLDALLSEAKEGVARAADGDGAHGDGAHGDGAVDEKASLAKVLERAAQLDADDSDSGGDGSDSSSSDDDSA